MALPFCARLFLCVCISRGASALAHFSEAQRLNSNALLLGRAPCCKIFAFLAAAWRFCHDLVTDGGGLHKSQFAGAPARTGAASEAASSGGAIGLM